MTKEDHIAYIALNGKFNVDCSHSIFDIDEIAFLEEYGHWSQALINGHLEPITEEQKDFIDIFKNNK